MCKAVFLFPCGLSLHSWGLTNAVCEQGGKEANLRALCVTLNTSVPGALSHLTSVTKQRQNQKFQECKKQKSRELTKCFGPFEPSFV